MSLNHSVCRNILGNKINDYYEVEVCLFQYCSKGCSFCFQDNKDRTGLDSILKKPYHIAKWISENKINLPCKVNILGGELFSKEHRSRFHEYYKFCDSLKFLLKDIDLEYNFISNLCFDTGTRWYVKSLLDQLNATVSTSWNFDQNSMLDNFHSNLVALNDRISIITFVLTKTNIQLLMNEERRDYFEWLTNNYEVQWDYYTPNKYAEELMPSDKELYDCLSFLIENFPELTQVKSLLNKGEVKTSCLSPNKVTFLPNGEIVACRQRDYDQSEFRAPIDLNCNENIINDFIVREKCLSCKYFSGCPLSCFVMYDHYTFIKKRELDECLYKKLFDKYKPNVLL